MGTTGLIFGIIVIAWLAYLVPLYLKKHPKQAANPIDPAQRFRNVRPLTVVASAEAADEQAEVEVSTPATRRALITEMQRMDRRAAGRRRMSLLVLTTAVTATLVLSLLGVAPWWGIAISGGLLIAFLTAARFSVRSMQHQFAVQVREIRKGNTEETVRIIREAAAKPVQRRTPTAASVASVEMGVPIGTPGTLWDPLPITKPTYVSSAAPRTVRTIDLSAPESGTPVVADAPGRPTVVRTWTTESGVRRGGVEGQAELRRAVGQ